MPGLRVAALFLLIILFTPFNHAAEGVLEVNLSLRGLVYDPISDKLYGTTGTNSLVQIDPISGAILATFPIGTNPSRVQLSAGHGLWVGLDGEGAVRRFNLGTMTAEEPIVIQPGGTIRDIAPSTGDTYTLVVVVRVPGQPDRAYALRNAQVLPNTMEMGTVTIFENSIYGTGGTTFVKGELGALGLIHTLSVGGVGYGDPEVFGGFIYHTFFGNVFRENPFVFQKSLLGNGTYAEGVALNKQTDALFYLINGSNWTLRRFDRLSLGETGLSVFGQGRTDPGFVDLQAWGTNRVAFHTTSKLYLLEVDKLFLPADLEVFQKADSSAFPFGTNVTITVTVTNKGPGPALQVVLNNYIETEQGGGRVHILRAFNGAPIKTTESSSLRSEFPLIPAGTSQAVSITYMPRTPGIFTNRVSVSGNFDPILDNNTNTLTVPILPPTNGIAKIAIPFVDVALDSSNGRLLALSNEGTELWKFDPVTLMIFDPVGGFYPGAARLTVSPQDGTVYLGFVPFLGNNVNVARIPGPSSILGSGTLADLEVSPTDTDLVALSSTAGTILYEDGSPLPDQIAQSGSIGFSSDGAKLYRNNSATCALEVYAVTPNGLSSQQSFPGVGCSEFVVAHGHLYFQNGLIFDPATGGRVPNTPVVSPPAFVSPSPNGGFELLTRTNGTWVLRRFHSSGVAGYENFANREIAGLTNTVLELLTVSADRVAVNTATGLLFVDLPEDATAIRATISHTPTTTNLRFSSTSGAQYRLESTTGLNPPSWTTTQDNITGTGAIISVPIPTANQSAFYRLARIP